MIPPFSEMLGAIADAEFVIDPTGNSEPNGNLCTISLSRDQTDRLAAINVVEFIHSSRRVRLDAP